MSIPVALSIGGIDQLGGAGSGAHLPSLPRELGAHGPAVISGGLLVIPASASAYTPYDE